MSVLPQTFFTFVSGHFMSFSFFTAWHRVLFLNVLFYFGYKRFCRLESWYIMSRNNNSSILGDIPCSFFSSFLNDEASKTPEINVTTFNHRIFYSFHLGFYSFL